MLGKTFINVRMWQKFAQKHIVIILLKYSLLNVVFDVLFRLPMFV
jgi:hypothetical protein